MKNRSLKTITIISLAVMIGMSLPLKAGASTINIAIGGSDIASPGSYGNDDADTEHSAEGEGREGGSNSMEFIIEGHDNIDRTSKINKGVYVDSVDISGMTYDEAVRAVNNYVSSLSEKEITLVSIDDNRETVTAGELGIKWANKEVLEDALKLGTAGNLISRYKELKDLEHENKVYNIRFAFDEDLIKDIVKEQAEKYNVEAVNATLSRSGGEFRISEGNTGYEIDVDDSVKKIASSLENWNKENIGIDLKVNVTQPKGTTEELKQVKDILGTFTTSFSTSSSDRSGNVRNGCSHINGSILYPGEQLSVYDKVSPFTEENGYYMAGSYLNGMVVESLGGGICQVSSTLYNAVLKAELQVDERYNHSMVVTYVSLSGDAAIAGTAKDFKFTNNTEHPIYIDGYTTEDKKITFTIYGVESRPSNRTVEYESVEISKTEPVGDRVIGDSSHPVGFISTQSAHTGYEGELWKIVKVDGKQTERTQVNRSVYKPTQRTATVGTATSDPGISAAIQSAIETQNIDYCKSVIAQLNAVAAAADLGVTGESQ